MNGKKILIVEDDFYIRKMYMKSFMLAGYDVEAAGDAESLFAKLEKDRYDGILLDVMLPQMSGVEILQKIRTAETSFKNIPIFVVSNVGDPKVKASVIAGGAQGFIQKSDHEPQEIVQELDRFFTKEKAPIQSS